MMNRDEDSENLIDRFVQKNNQTVRGGGAFEILLMNWLLEDGLVEMGLSYAKYP